LRIQLIDSILVTFSGAMVRPVFEDRNG